MANVSESPSQLVVTSGATTVTLDRHAGTATLHRKILLWTRKPAEMSLSDICECAVDTAVDRASGVEMCNAVLVARSGTAWALPAADKKDAQTIAAQVRAFLGLDAPTAH